MIRPTRRRAAGFEPRKWFNSLVTSHAGTLASIGNCIPTFERRGFALTQPGGEKSALNQRLDTIVRMPFGEDQNFIPVGVVSKDYTLVQHGEVLNAAKRAIAVAGVKPEEVRAELDITEYGERMALSLYLPKKYSYTPADDHPMDLRLECWNSVDGSTRFRALMGWLRLVCSNGLVIGVTRSDIRRRHSGDFCIEDIGAVLQAGLCDAENEKRNFEEWRKATINPSCFLPWVEGDLKRAWGFKAAARAFHIARCGCDVDVCGPYKDNTPSTVPVRMANLVPGSPCESRTLYDVSQILAWLAKERRDLQEQLEWREQIPALIQSLR